MKFCTRCGTALDANSKFCVVCGMAYPVAVISEDTTLSDDTDQVTAHAHQPDHPALADIDGFGDVHPFPDGDPTTVAVNPSVEAGPDDTNNEVNGMCAACATPFEADDLFCTQCGKTRTAAWDDAADDDAAPAARRTFPARKIGFIVLAIVVTVTAYLVTGRYRQIPQSELVAMASPAAGASSGAATPDPAPDLGGTPVVNGRFKAVVGDQQIALTINPDAGRPLASSVGVAAYTNDVAGKTCAAAVTPIAGDVVAGGQAFDQQPIAGMPRCDRNIRLRLSLADAGRLSAVWTDPITGAELMQAQLASY